MGRIFIHFGTSVYVPPPKCMTVVAGGCFVEVRTNVFCYGIHFFYQYPGQPYLTQFCMMITKGWLPCKVTVVNRLHCVSPCDGAVVLKHNLCIQYVWKERLCTKYAVERRKSGFYMGSNFWGGTYTSVYTYVCTHQCGAARHMCIQLLETTLMHAAYISGFLSE